jgi:sporulation protein YlmC with PRC-barrel domain
MATQQWKEILSQAKDLAKRASQVSREELKRMAHEIEIALDKASTEVEKMMLELHKRIVDSARASREPLLLGKEVVTSDGISLGSVKDVRLELESKRVWLVVGKMLGEPRNIAVDDIKAIGDKIVLQLEEKEITLKEDT